MSDSRSEEFPRRLEATRFEDFVRQHTATVLRFCLGRCRDRHTAEDAAQEALLRLHQQVHRGDAPREPLSWVLGVARRCCLELERHRKRDGGLELDEQTHTRPASSAEPATSDVDQILGGLSDSERAIIHLKHTEGLKCRQIAAALDRPLGSVTAVLARAYAKLRPRLLEEFGS